MITYTPTPDYYNDYICHFNPYHDPTNGQFTFGNGGPTYGGNGGIQSSNKKKKNRIFDRSVAKIEKGFKNGKISVDDLSPSEWRRVQEYQMSKMNKENPGFEEWYRNNDPNSEHYDLTNPEKHLKDFNNSQKDSGKLSQIERDNEHGFMSANVSRGKKREPLGISVNTDSGLTEQDMKNYSKKLLKNEKQIEKLAKQAILEDSYLYDTWGKDRGLTKQQFIDALEIKSMYVSKKGWPVEISVWEKDGNSDLLGYHSLDMDIDLDNPKKPKYVSMNG